VELWVTGPGHRLRGRLELMLLAVAVPGSRAVGRRTAPPRPVDAVRAEPRRWRTPNRPDRGPGKAAGAICGRAGTSDVVDGLVVITALRLHALVVTSDLDDLQYLASNLHSKLAQYAVDSGAGHRT